MNDPNRVQLVAELERLGFFAGVAPEELDEVRASALHFDLEEMDGEPLYDRRTGRVVPFDSEDLAEGVAPEILKNDFAPHLKRWRITINDVQYDESEQADQVLLIDGQRYLLTTAEEADWNNWRAASVRLGLILNCLLAAAGAADRAYLVDVGDMSLMLFLTPAMYRAIAASEAVIDFIKPIDPEEAAEDEDEADDEQ